VKRAFDIVASLSGLICISPFLIIICVIVGLTSKGGVFYFQERIGLNGIPFRLFKFRTMFTNSDKKGLLTVGDRDPRITPIGYYLRKYKLDELPQLLNVVIGNMSIVGPRPEVKKYVDLYSEEQRRVLLVKPGITDYASLNYFDENELLAKTQNPEQTYIEEIMPAKLKLNAQYISEVGFVTDIKIIFKTLKRIVS
jgi:lipopolysaccharide/colanic/teichoic acid biosynthesis glycosyltransferase